MNFNGFDFDDDTKQTLEAFDSQGRMPHAVIIESSDTEKSLELAKYLSMWAVCKKNDNKPCMMCEQCHKASEKAHADINYAYPEKKSKTYTIEQMRNIINDAYIMPNEADAKVYVFEQADNRLAPVVQNAFLKLLEEPPKNVSFILLCKNTNKLLITILSRCTLIKLKKEEKFDETATEYAKAIVRGILSTREYDLLLALNKLTEKEKADEILLIVKLILRDGLAVLSGGKTCFDEVLGNSISRRISIQKIIEMIELTENAKQKIPQNININLLTTQLCGEYRRILWQR